MSQPDFPDGFQGAGPMFAAIPPGPWWCELSDRGATTYTVGSTARLLRGSPAGGAVLFDKADAEALADAADNGLYTRWDDRMGGHFEKTPARIEAERFAKQAHAQKLAGPERPADARMTPEADGRAQAPEAGVMNFPEDSWVEVRYPLTSEQEPDRSAWPWVPGWVVTECGPDEWEICVQAPELAAEHDGDTVYPVCWRDSSELRSQVPEPQAGGADPGGPEAGQ
jgi:hypothetical protein